MLYLLSEGLELDWYTILLFEWQKNHKNGKWKSQEAAIQAFRKPLEQATLSEAPQRPGDHDNDDVLILNFKMLGFV